LKEVYRSLGHPLIKIFLNFSLKLQIQFIQPLAITRMLSDTHDHNKRKNVQVKVSYLTV